MRSQGVGDEETLGTEPRHAGGTLLVAELGDDRVEQHAQDLKIGECCVRKVFTDYIMVCTVFVPLSGFWPVSFKTLKHS